MQKRQWGLISLLVTVLVVIVRTNLEMTANKTRDGINEGTNSQSGTINTEGKNTPEIIVDPDKLAELPKQEEKPKDVAQVKDDIEENGTPTANTIPNAFSLDIPFYAQAPDGDRELPRKEACEEASIALAAYYIQDRKPSKNQFKEDIIALTKLEEDLFGTYIDTTITQTAELYNKFYGIGTTKIIDNPTIDQIKTEIAQGHVIVAPFAGRELGNSYFTNGGPRYHMLVIRGYDEKYFYTNDVGTKHGNNFPYSYKTIMSAMHDLVRVEEGNISDGKKRILVIMH